MRKCFKAMIRNDLAAGIVFVFPHFALRGRNIAFPEFKGKTTTKQVKMINEKISRISRVVVHPKFRSIGLGAEIARQTSPNKHLDKRRKWISSGNTKHDCIMVLKRFFLWLRAPPEEYQRWRKKHKLSSGSW